MALEKSGSHEGITVANGTVLLEKSLMPQISALTQLKLNNCGLSEIPDSISCSIAALQSLEASHNSLTKLPQSFGQLKELVNLNLSYNQLNELPDSFGQLAALETVNLSHNNFDSPPSCFQVGNVNISNLNISFNKIEDWKHGPLCAYGLKYFNCSNNRLICNPPWIWDDFCRSLETLDLSCNEFSNPTATLRPYSLWRTGVSVGLKFLVLRNCGITTDHLSLVHKLKAIESLDLGNDSSATLKGKSNFIWDITFKFFQSSHLSEMNLDGVGLPTLSEDINCLKNIRILKLNNNTLQWLPENITDLENLEYLSVSNNQLLYIPNDFGKLSNIQQLFLDCNKLEELPPSFADLQSLQYLDLYDNRFADIPPCLDRLNCLCGLDMKYNYFDSDMKEELCFNLRERRGVLNRAEGVKQKAPTPYSQSPCSSYSSGYSDDRLKDQEDFENAGEPDLETTEENWDLEDEDDEYFDPTVYQPRSQVDMPVRALIIHTAVIGPHSFIPSDIHPSPIQTIKNPFSSNDGQFEDA